MDLTNDEKRSVNRTYNVGYGHAPIDVKYVSMRPSDRRSRRRAHHFGALSLLLLSGLVYWYSKRPSPVHIAKHGQGCHGSADVKIPQIYPAGVTPEVAEILPMFNWTAVRNKYNPVSAFDTLNCLSIAPAFQRVELDRMLRRLSMRKV